MYRYGRLFLHGLSDVLLSIALCPRTYTKFVSGYFFPPAGYRFRMSGALTGVGSEGHCWSSMSSDFSGVRLGSNGANVCFYANGRTFGYSLRCVQAFTVFCCGSIFFPSAGYLGQNTAVLTNFDPGAYCWASTSMDLRAVSGGYYDLYMCFYVGSRTYGFSLRCVQVFTSFVAGAFISRLRGIVAGIWELWRMSEASVITGCRLFRRSFPGGWSFRVRALT